MLIVVTTTTVTKVTARTQYNIKPSNDAAIKICEDADAREDRDMQRMRTRAKSRVLKELDLGSASRRATK